MQILSFPHRPLFPPPRTMPARAPVDARRGCRLAREVASAFFAIPVHEMDRPTRAVAATCQARHVAMYLAHVVFQVPLVAMAREFHRDRSSVAYGIRRTEDRRDEPEFDALLVRLEHLCEALRDAVGEDKR